MANEVVGTCVCYGKTCSEITSVHETKRGGATRKSKLYLNCPECRCLQPTSAASQKYIKENMVPRAGYEYLCEPKSEPKEAKNEPENEPEEKAAKSAEKPVSKAPLAVLGVFVLGALALLS